MIFQRGLTPKHLFKFLRYLCSHDQNLQFCVCGLWKHRVLGPWDPDYQTNNVLKHILLMSILKQIMETLV
jgi:hypothetical protein